MCFNTSYDLSIDINRYEFAYILPKDTKLYRIQVNSPSSLSMYCMVDKKI